MRLCRIFLLLRLIYLLVHSCQKKSHLICPLSTKSLSRMCPLVSPGSHHIDLRVHPQAMQSALLRTAPKDRSAHGPIPRFGATHRPQLNQIVGACTLFLWAWLLLLWGIGELNIYNIEHDITAIKLIHVS